MAYKSRVRQNQYFGATFAGQQRAPRSTDTTNLINTLKDISPDLEKIAKGYVEQKNVTAEKKINELFLTKDADTIRDEVIAGQHPELSSQYVQKTVSFHTGKHEAAATIAEIEKNKNKYDFRNGDNLSSFYRQYLPEFNGKDGSYALGFASVFNEYKADAMVKDGVERSKYAQEQKIQQGVTILNASKPEDVITKANALEIKLPPEEGGNTPRDFYNKEEINDVIVAWANNKLATATTPEQIDEALLVLKSDRKVDEQGNVLVGSLASTSRKDVAVLIGKLNSQRVTLENQSRAEKEYQLRENKKDIWLKSISKKEDGTYPTLKEKEAMLQELQSLDPTDIKTINAFRTYHTTDPQDRTIANSQTEREFKLNIAKGLYQTHSDMVEAYTTLGIQGDVEDYTKQWKSWEGTRGTQAIFDRNTNYVSAKQSVKEIFTELYPKDALGNTSFRTKYAAAEEWINEQILDKEQEWSDKGVIPSSDDRRKFAKELKQDAIDLFGTEQKFKEQATTEKSYSDIRTEEKAAESLQELKEEEAQFRTQALNTEVSRIDMGDGAPSITTVSDVINNISENIQRAGKQKLAKVRPFAEGIISDEELFRQVNKPRIKKYINNVLGENFDADFMALLPQQDYNKIVMDIANSFGMLKKIPKGTANRDELLAQNKQALKTISMIIQQSIQGQ